jgi:hypothetical protein
MKRGLFLIAALLLGAALYGQQPGDTIVVSAFKYGSTSRDTLLSFPSGNLTFERIIMKYNMRCKNALVSTQSAPDQGCGEWDYSCNTFIVDSSKIETVPATHPSHLITGFSGSSFLYTSNPLYDYYRFRLVEVALDSILSENQYAVGSGTVSIPQALRTDQKSGRSQFLYTASDLTNAGFTAGAINGIILNVLNAGGTAHFLKVGIQHSMDTMLTTESLLLSGFQNVFNSHYSFVSGTNRLQFHTPFVWDGISGLLLEFTFTNTQPDAAIVLAGHTTPLNRGISALNNFAMDLSANGLVNINTTQLSGISNEVTVAFWSYGDPDLLPANTSILYGYANNQGQRHLNIHLPWGNGSVYWDCGFSGTYDRIFKAATPSEYKGQWNHWAFTKNAAAGNMSIYLNGALWHTGSGMTKSMSIQNLLLGNNQTATNNYKGSVNELTIWNKALSQAEIAGWRHRVVDATHPSYSNLVAYYKGNEGSGDSIHDARYNAVSAGSSLQWTYERGDRLSTTFTELAARPDMVLLRGAYITDTTQVFALDSVQRNPNIVRGYTITPAPAGTAQHDVVTLVSTMQLYHASPIKLTDGDSDTLITTFTVVPDDSLQITNLQYFRRFPWYNEIMSFVTPYGKGLDLGFYGKTWYFDVTDFKPLLQGNKRMMMTGGVWQEELDIDFLFVVGTPYRNVIEFNQLWQGSARDGQASIAAINNNNRFAPLQVPLAAQGDHFVLRATITGHGSEGEFHQNGGAVDHYFRIDSTINNFSWQITEECAFNPVFPQGGTWVYDRQGWCPGQVSLTKFLNLTPLLTAGTTTTLDYHCAPPQNPSGDYRYLAAFQLVTYGPPNHNLDAYLVDVKSPSDKVLHSRINPVCANPEIVVMNTGATVLSSMDLHYWLNNAATKQTYTWTGSLAPMDSIHITLPTASLWSEDFQTASNVFHAEIVAANGVADDYTLNNRGRSSFEVAEKIAGRFIVEIRTNNYPQQNKYRIEDEAGNVIPGSSSLVTANTIYRDTFDLDGCYTLFFEDSGHDGLSWWANTAQGTGYARLKNVNGSIIKTFQPDFGGGFQYSFTTSGLISVPTHDEGDAIIIYPNPATDMIRIDGKGLGSATLFLTDLTGRVIRVPMISDESRIECDVAGLPRGVFFVHLLRGEELTLKKIILQ